MTRSVSRAVRVVGLVVTLWAVSSCGGGDGSSSSGPSFVGRYVGTANTVLSSPAGSTPVNGSIEFVVAADNTVTVSDPGQPPAGTGTLNGNTFTATVPGSFFNSPGISCGGTIAFNGTISGTSMNGNVSSNAFVCNSAPFTLTGTFTASLQAELPRNFTGGGIGEGLRNAIRSR